VTKCTLADPADLKRISLTVNRQGRVLSIISAAGRSLFGFQPNDLVGQRLGNFVNVFATWRIKHGDEGSLLLLLLLLLSMRAEEHIEEAWRVGVHLPVTDEEVEDKMTEADKAKVGPWRLLACSRPVSSNPTPACDSSDHVFVVGLAAHAAAAANAFLPRLCTVCWRAPPSATTCTLVHKQYHLLPHPAIPATTLLLLLLGVGGRPLLHGHALPPPGASRHDDGAAGPHRGG